MGKVQEVISKYETGTLSNVTFQQIEAQSKVQTTLEQLLLSCDMNSPPTTYYNSATNEVNSSGGQGFMNVRPVQTSYPLTPLSSGGFIFNYPPLYSFAPISPFSQQVIVSPDNSPISPPTSPIYPPTSPSDSLTKESKRQEKLEKYRLKRVKRNWNRPVDQARRERAQHRVRDEHGHFVSSKQTNSKNLQDEMQDVKLQLAEFREESLLLKNKLSEVSTQLEEQQRLNTALSAFLHENRVFYSSVPMNDLFNTLNPNNSYADAFKEKIDLSNIDLHWTDNPYLLDKDSSSSSIPNYAPLDPHSFS